MQVFPALKPIVFFYFLEVGLLQEGEGTDLLIQCEACLVKHACFLHNKEDNVAKGGIFSKQSKPLVLYLLVAFK